MSIIIPVYRRETILTELFNKNTTTLGKRIEYEVLFISDGCDRESERIVEQLKFENNLVKTFRLAHYYDQHRAIQCGFSIASGDFVVIIDEDLQHDPADIPRLIEKQ